MTSGQGDSTLVDQLNRECFCIGTDLDALHRWLEDDLVQRGLDRPVLETHPHLFSALPVFVSAEQIARMQAIIAAVEAVVALPAYRAAVLADAPAIARFAPRQSGVLMGYDFHVSDAGPQLIEINTNAGGAMLNAALARAQRACCPEVEALLSAPAASGSLEDALLAAFLEEWRLARGDAPLARIAIVDDSPTAQYLYPEFLLFQRLFESHGIAAVVADPAELSFDHGVLSHPSGPIDLVYNRLTDFYLQAGSAQALRRAYEAGAAVVTPHPHAHAIYANKRNLALLTSAGTLRQWQVDEPTIATLTRGIPETVAVTTANADALWAERKRWFFKPARGFGSRGSYRGDKLTTRVFAAIRTGDYVAQRVAPPSERHHLVGTEPVALKVDLRNYVYRGRTQMVAARLYQGQTTNFRTPGGGFAPVFHPRA